MGLVDPDKRRPTPLSHDPPPPPHDPPPPPSPAFLCPISETPEIHFLCGHRREKCWFTFMVSLLSWCDAITSYFLVTRLQSCNQGMGICVMQSLPGYTAAVYKKSVHFQGIASHRRACNLWTEEFALHLGLGRNDSNSISTHISCIACVLCLCSCCIHYPSG